MPVDFLPPYTEVQSRLHVRLVWAHDKRFHWWMPEQGFEYDMVVRSYSRYNEDQNSNPQQPSSCSGLYPPTCPSTSWCGLPIINNGVQLQRGVCKRLKLGLHAQFSPEFINDGNYPRPSQARPHESIITHWNSHATSLNGVKHGDALAVAVGETLEVMVRVFDRNGNDENVIKAREDPGLRPDTSSPIWLTLHRRQLRATCSRHTQRSPKSRNLHFRRRIAHRRRWRAAAVHVHHRRPPTPTRACTTAGPGTGTRTAWT